MAELIEDDGKKCYWNYRVTRQKSPFEDEPDWLEIHEVHYEDDIPVGYGQATVGGDSIEEIKYSLQKMAEALEKPILDYPK